MNNQDVLAKYGKKFAGTDSARPILEGIHYATDGTAFVTNAHYGLQIRNAHNFNTPMTLNAKTGSPIEGVYPDLSRVFPDRYDNTITIGAKDLKDLLLRVRCAADVASRINKKVPVITLDAHNETVFIKIINSDKGLDFSAYLGTTLKNDTSKRSLNAEYLYTALSLFSDTNTDMIVKLGVPLSPIVLTDGNDIDVVILPYRV
jgi:DNA polymerase III sliding clamp (beta) subunit (PCNA family)